jgi:UDP-N-acetylmuramate dehydrogenase
MLSYKSGKLRINFTKESVLSRVEKTNNFYFSNNTTYGLGGRAEEAYFPKKLLEARAVFDYVKDNKKKYFIIGNGSNVLASDGGFNGVVISTKKLKGIINCGNNTLFCLAGTTVYELLNYCKSHSLGGLEYLYGIPATIGGLACMNGGAGGNYIAQNIKAVKIYNGKISNLSNQNCNFGLKHSTMRDINSLILGVFVSVLPSSPQSIQSAIDYYKDKRKAQPKGKSCGCMFVNNGQIPSGKLIDLAGLKGLRVGGAYVSCVHANFIINENGTSDDVKKLIEIIKRSVYEKFGVSLKEEVIILDSDQI